MPAQTEITYCHSNAAMLAAAIDTMRLHAAKHAANHESIVLSVYYSYSESKSGYYPAWTFALEDKTNQSIETRRFAVAAMSDGGHFTSFHSLTRNARIVRETIRDILGPEFPTGGWRIHPQSLAPQSLQGWTVLDAASKSEPESASDPATPHADKPASTQCAEIDFDAHALFTRIQCASLAIRDGDIITHSPAIVGTREDGSKRVFVNWEVTFRDPENGERDAIAFASAEIGLRLEAEWDHATRMQEETGVLFISAERMLANLTSEWS